MPIEFPKRHACCSRHFSPSRYARQTQPAHLREPERHRGHLVRLAFASLIFSSIFIRGPLRRPGYIPRDRPLSPRFPYRIFIGRSSPGAAPGDIKHDARRGSLGAKRNSIVSVTIDNEPRSYCAIKRPGSEFRSFLTSLSLIAHPRYRRVRARLITDSYLISSRAIFTFTVAPVTY